MPRAQAPSRVAQQGFALLALLALLTAGILYFLIGHLDTVGERRRQDEATAQALARAKEALIAYALTYRDAHADEVFGYLPCPDANGDGSGDAGNCGAAAETVVGLFPYKQVGLADLRDGSGACLWYAVSASFKAPLTKPTPMNWDTQGTIRIQDTNGNLLASPDDKYGGVAAVIIAPGPPLPGQNRSANGASLCDAKPIEYASYLDGVPAGGGPNIPYSFPSSANPVTVVLGTPDVTGAKNNDRLLWITPQEIFDRVKKRNDVANLLNSGMADTQAQLSSGPLVAANAAHQLPSTNPFGPNTSDHNFYDNWQDQFRYVTCATVDSYCFTVNGAQCDGVLLFGGANVNGHPRASTQRSDSNYFESADALALLADTGSTFSGSSAYDGSTVTTRATDVGLCLRKK